MTALPANELEAALLAANDDGIVMDRVLALLAQTELLVPVGGDPKDGDLSFPVIEFRDRRYVGIFTSPAQAQRPATHAGGFLRMTGTQLAALWPPDVDMVVNPGGDFGTVVPEGDVRRWRAEEE